MNQKIILKVSNHIFLIVLITIFSQNLSAQNNHSQWPAFRGQNASGVLDNANIPIKWNIDNTKNIKWKTAIPGMGHSCPVIWNDKLFVTTAAGEKDDESLKVGLYGDIDMAKDEGIYKFKVYCLNKNTGEIIWEKIAHEGKPKSKRHTKSSQANSTPATDGKHLVVCFGSEGLFCYDLNGKLLWRKDLGIMNPGPFNGPGVEWGYSSSPVIHNGRIIIQNDSQNSNYLATFDIETGKEIWRTERDEISTWGSPCIYSKNGKSQIIVNGWKHMGGYDFETGEVIWKMNGGGDAPAPTPVVYDDLIYINNAHGRFSPIYVVKPTAKGDITLGEKDTTNQHILWSIKRGGAYMQTPLIYKNYLYNMRGNGMLTCFDAKTGEVMYKENLRPGTGISSSGVATDNKLYFTSEKGDVFVIRAGPEFELLAKNPLNDLHMSTPAITKGAIYFRTQHYVIAVAKEGL
ncbi:PQQ-binding-like beta-propeller repeat protein [Bacteroidota bacterium]